MKLPRTLPRDDAEQREVAREIALDPSSALQTSRRVRAELQREIVARLPKFTKGKDPRLARARQIFFPLITWAPVPLLEKISGTFDTWEKKLPSPATVLARAEIWESERKGKINR